MKRFAPRLSPRLLAEVGRLAGRDLAAAEVARRVGDLADALGLTRPSYERVRVLVREHRRRTWQPSTSEVLVGVAMRARPPEALLEHLAGVGVPKEPTRR